MFVNYCLSIPHLNIDSEIKISIETSLELMPYHIAAIYTITILFFFFAMFTLSH